VGTENTSGNATIPDIQYLDSLEQVHAVSTKARRRILQLLVDEPMTVTQLGRALEMPPPTVQHHVRELLRVGLVHLQETRERRGILEKYYRAAAHRFLLPRDPLAGHSPSEQLATVNELLEDISHHVSAVLSGYSGQDTPEDAVQLAVRVLFLRPDDLPEIAERIESILGDYLEPRDRAVGREHIVVHLAVPTHPRRPESEEGGKDSPGDSP
jgi:DNA-binding transcriptional ArsR family regulator